MDPVNKYPEPQTSNQEVGWLIPKLPKMARKRGQNFHIRNLEHTTWMVKSILDGCDAFYGSKK